MKQESTYTIVDHLFREEYGKVVSYLTYRYGTSQLEGIEDATQEAFLRAMKAWGYGKIPNNPTAWLLRVANNQMIDQFRKAKKFQNSETPQPYLDQASEASGEVTFSETISDSQLKMIFACCHPSLSTEYQIILSLKLIGGFHNKEIAEALLKKEEAVAKAFTRAKRRLQQEIKTLESPVAMGLQSRRIVVFRVIYLLFSEGYAATQGKQAMKRDICYEAIRLALLLHENPYTHHPNLDALIALMCFHVARFDARIDQEGGLVVLEHHDRSKYDRKLISIGVRHLEASDSTTQKLSNYHLEAAVSYYHCIAPTFQETDWASILKLYDLQLKQVHSPVVALNRVIPVLKVEGPVNAMKALEHYRNLKGFKEHGLYYAIKAEVEKEAGNIQKSKVALEKAIAMAQNEAEKLHLQKKLQALTS